MALEFSRGFLFFKGKRNCERRRGFRASDFVGGEELASSDLIYTIHLASLLIPPHVQLPKLFKDVFDPLALSNYVSFIQLPTIIVEGPTFFLNKIILCFTPFTLFFF